MSPITLSRVVISRSSNFQLLPPEGTTNSECDCCIASPSITLTLTCLRCSSLLPYSSIHLGDTNDRKTTIENGRILTTSRILTAASGHNTQGLQPIHESRGSQRDNPVASTRVYPWINTFTSDDLDLLPHKYVSENSITAESHRMYTCNTSCSHLRLFKFRVLCKRRTPEFNAICLTSDFLEKFSQILVSNLQACDASMSEKPIAKVIHLTATI